MLAFSNDYYGFIFRATQSVELFCAYITKASYYWRLRKVREAYLKTADHTQTFVEVPSSAIQPVNMAAEYKIIALIRGRNNLTLEITEQASDSFLKTLLGVLGNAQ